MKILHSNVSFGFEREDGSVEWAGDNVDVMWSTDDPEFIKLESVTGALVLNDDEGNAIWELKQRAAGGPDDGA